METILDEVERALEAQLWYAAVALALTIPDVCASLEATPNARRDGQRARYLAWCRKNLPDDYGLDPELCWDLRSGVLHEGRYKHKRFDRVAFTVPSESSGTIHNIELVTPQGTILPLSVPLFCAQIVQSARAWYATNKDKPQVREKLKRLPQLTSDGLAPYVRGPITLG